MTVNGLEDVRSYREGDEAQIVEVLRKSLPEWAAVKNPLEYWNWKYKSNPNGFECFTISVDDRILGVNHNIEMKIKIGDEVVHAHCATDAAIHPDYRGKGLYTKLRIEKKLIQSTHKVVTFWSARNPIMIDSSARRGRLTVPFKISHMMRIKNIQRHLENNPSNKPWSYPALFFMRSLNILGGFIRPVKMDEVQVSRITGFNPEIDDFCDRLHEYYRLTRVRDHHYLNWRYCNPEADEVVVLQAQKGQKIVGFCAAEVKLSARGQFEAHILDLLCLPEDLVTPYCLLKELLGILDERDVNDVHLRVTGGHPYRLISKSCGFIDITRWSVMEYFINEREGHEYFKKNIEEMASFPRI